MMGVTEAPPQAEAPTTTGNMQQVRVASRRTMAVAGIGCLFLACVGLAKMHISGTKEMLQSGAVEKLYNDEHQANWKCATGTCVVSSVALRGADLVLSFFEGGKTVDALYQCKEHCAAYTCSGSKRTGATLVLDSLHSKCQCECASACNVFETNYVWAGQARYETCTQVAVSMSGSWHHFCGGTGFTSTEQTCKIATGTSSTSEWSAKVQATAPIFQAGEATASSQASYQVTDRSHNSLTVKTKESVWQFVVNVRGPEGTTQPIRSPLIAASDGSRPPCPTGWDGEGEMCKPS